MNMQALWTNIVRIFGQDDMDAAETAVRLAAEWPSFDMYDFFSVIDEAVRRHGTAQDVIPLPGNVSRWNAFSRLGHAGFRSLSISKPLYVSDIVFRNLYRILFYSCIWDDDILFRPEFVDELASRVAKMKSRVAGFPRQVFLDTFETLSEFMEKATEKIQARSGM